MHTTKRTAALGIFTAVALALAACGGDDDTGGEGDTEGAAAEGEPILIGNIADLTGATGDVGTPYSEGIRGYVDWRNEQGGI
ncbi:MAG: branched-chain amino acid ABC transporter substrate-binding protein, partial [Jiangellaceae bacterium]